MELLPIIRTHVQKLYIAAEYREAVLSLCGDAKTWREGEREFSVAHPEMATLPGRLRLPSVIAEHPARQSTDVGNHEAHTVDSAVRRWGAWLSLLESDYWDLVDTADVLKLLTGTDDIETAVRFATESRPVLAWASFEEIVVKAKVKAEAGGSAVAIIPGETEKGRLRMLAEVVERQRVILTQAVLENSALDDVARSALVRLEDCIGLKTRMGNEPDVREALRDLGFPPARSRRRLLYQLWALRLTNPEFLHRQVATALKAAEDLKALTGAETTEHGVRRARRTLGLQEDDRPRDQPARVMVYSGDLPTLGESR